MVESQAVICLGKSTPVPGKTCWPAEDPKAAVQKANCSFPSPCKCLPPNFRPLPSEDGEDGGGKHAITIHAGTAPCGGKDLRISN